MLCACLPSDTIGHYLTLSNSVKQCQTVSDTVWEQFYQKLELNTDSWATLLAQQIVYKSIVDKSNKKHIANKDVSADIFNYVERTKIKTSLKFK